MPLDPMIARGVQVPGLGGSYLAAEEIKNRRQYNQNMMDRMAAGDQAAQAETAKAQEEQELRMLYPAVKAGDPRAVQYVTSKIAAKNPQLGELYTQNPALLTQALEQGLGIEVEQPPAPVELQQLGGYQLLQQGGKVIPGSVQAPQRAPLAGPREPPRPSLVDVPLPDGTTQKQWIVPGQTTGAPVGAPAKPKAPQAEAPKITSAEASTFRGVVRKSIDLDAALKRLEDDIAQNGLQIGGLGEAGGRQSGYYKSVLFKLKEVQNLGVLNGPDLMLLTQQLNDPTSFQQGLKGMTPGRISGQIAALRAQARDEAASARSILEESGAYLPAALVLKDQPPKNETPKKTFKHPSGATVEILD